MVDYDFLWRSWIQLGSLSFFSGCSIETHDMETSLLIKMGCGIKQFSILGRFFKTYRGPPIYEKQSKAAAEAFAAMLPSTGLGWPTFTSSLQQEALCNAIVVSDKSLVAENFWQMRKRRVLRVQLTGFARGL